MYSSYPSLKYEIFPFNFSYTVLYSTCGYSNPFFNSISFINNNILHFTSLIALLIRDYSFSDPESASVTTAKFSHFLNSGQQLSLPQWSEPWHVQQRPWRKSVVLLLFSSFLGFGSGLYHIPDHPTGLKAVDFLYFPLEPLLVAKPPLVAAEPPLVIKPHELKPQENFKEDCSIYSHVWKKAHLDQRLKNVFSVKKQALNIAKVREKLEARLKKAQKAQAKYYNKNHTSHTFKAKDRVYFKNKNIELTCSSKKLDYKYYQLFEIEKLIEKQGY